VGTFALTGWRPSAAWRLLGLGVVAMFAGDVISLTEWDSTGYAYGTGAWFECAWALGLTVTAEGVEDEAARGPPGTRPRSVSRAGCRPAGGS
jgi:hypothetical protein